MNKFKPSTYEVARNKVLAIKGFYTHLMICLLFSILVLVFRNTILDFIMLKTQNVDRGFLDWVDANILLTPIIWGVVICIHALLVFRNKFSIFKSWEERKIKEYLNKEERDNTCHS